jgi:uncharacterized membrane protein YfcA
VGPHSEFDHPDTALRHHDGSDHLGQATGPRHGGSRRLFLRHVVEMVVAMMIGMFLGVGIFIAIIGVDFPQSRHQYPTAALLVMAVSMTIPMVAWMRYRRHSWRDSMEMGAAMLVPVVPFLVLLWSQVTREALTGPYMMLSTVAMLALMFYRWDVYSAHPVKRLRVGAR